MKCLWAFAAVILLSGCASPMIHLIAPANGAEECLLKPAQLKYVQMPYEERRAYLADAGSREELSSDGYYPREVMLAWQADQPGRGFFVTLSTSPDFAPGTCLFFTTGDSSLKVDNLLIAKTYYWKVSDGFVDSEVGSFQTADTAPRLLRIPDVENARDLGGRIGFYGRRVRQNMIVRSAGINHDAELIYYSEEEVGAGKKVVKRDADGKPWFMCGRDKLTDEGRYFLIDGLRVRSDLDLRNADECLGMIFSPLGPRIPWNHISSGAYRDIADKKAKEAFAKAFRLFLDKGNYPMILHGSAGQDRVGTLACILNGLLGVSENELYLDWEVSAFWNKSTSFNHASLFDKLIQVFAEYDGETLNERIENFVLSTGITRAEILQFRDIMLEP